MKRSLLLAPAAAAALLSGCEHDSPESELRTPTVLLYAPSEGVLPVPNDLLFNGSMDATLAIPVADPADVSDPLVALNSLDGWSVSAPFTIRFSRNVDASTVVAGSSVRMFEVTALVLPAIPVGGPVTGIVRELAAGNEFTIAAAPEYPGTTAVRIVLEQPLLASAIGANRVYMVVCTNDIRDAEGFRVSKDVEYLFASSEVPFDPGNPATAQLAALQQIVLAMEFAALSAGIDRSTIVMTMSFTTQSTTPALGTTLGITAGNEAAIIAGVCAGIPAGCADTTPSPFSTPIGAGGPAPIGTTATLIGTGPGFADVYVGSLTLPYYQTAASNPTFADPVSDPTPLMNHWRARYPFVPGDTDRNLTRFNPLPEATGREICPLLVTLPNGASGHSIPPDGWPVVIFQHGINRDRADVLYIADAFASAGFAAVSMDLPMHGLGPTNPLFLGYLNGTLRERTFGLDLLTNGTGEQVPDGIVDPTGQWFLNLANLRNSRDNLRQAVSDLFNLKATLGTFTVGGNALDASRVHFVGHSLGAIVGTPFLALQGGLTTGTLAAGGGGLPYLLDGSVFYNPILEAGLAAAGVLPDTPDYSSFLFAAQTVVDSADPIHYAAAVGASSLPLLFHEVVGGGPAGGLPDQSIPNAVAGAPLAGTEPLIAELGLPPVTATVMDPGGVRGAVRFIEGYHGSLLDPTTNLAATTEMQAQVAGFLASLGTTIPVANPSVIAGP